MQELDYQSGFLAGAAILAYIAVLFLMRQKRELRRQLTLFSQRSSTQAVSPAGSISTLFDMLPYPVLLYSKTGVVIYANPAFAQILLIHPERTTLDEVDHILGTHLNRPLANAARTIRHQVIRSARLSRQYFALSWPIHHQTTAQGRIILFCDQTETLRKKSSQHDFEHTLISHLAHINHVLHEKSLSPERITTLSEGLDDISRYLELTQPILHAAHSPELHRIAPTIQEVLQTIRPELRMRGITITSILAKETRAVVSPAHASLALHSALSALIPLIPQGHRATLNLSSSGNRTTILLSIPTVILTVRELTSLQQASQSSESHEGSRIRFATCRQVMHNAGGTVDLASNAEKGTTCTLLFKGATPLAEE
jgi:hypothetical protein